MCTKISLASFSVSVPIVPQHIWISSFLAFNRSSTTLEIAHSSALSWWWNGFLIILHGWMDVSASVHVANIPLLHIQSDIPECICMRPRTYHYLMLTLKYKPKVFLHSLAHKFHDDCTFYVVSFILSLFRYICIIFCLFLFMCQTIMFSISTFSTYSFSLRFICVASKNRIICSVWFNATLEKAVDEALRHELHEHMFSIRMTELSTFSFSFIIKSDTTETLIKYIIVSGHCCGISIPCTCTLEIAIDAISFRIWIS